MTSKNSIRFILTISFALLAACRPASFPAQRPLRLKAPVVPTAAGTLQKPCRSRALQEAAADGEAAANEPALLMDHVPLKEALDQLQPQEVFQNLPISPRFHAHPARPPKR